MSPVVALPPAPEGGPLDFRIQVFDTSFNVHSSRMKKLPYFSKSFKEKEEESSQGAAGGQSGTGLKYLWRSKIVDEEIMVREGKWAPPPKKWKLVEEEATASSLENFAQKAMKMPAITTVFEKLILAWYEKNYVIVKIEELLEITHLARGYGGLRTLSKSISPALRTQPKVISDIILYPCDVLAAAVYLRHEQLFKDALMICLGPWICPHFLQLKDEKLREVATKAYKNLCQKMVIFNQAFFYTLNLKVITIDQGDREKIQEKLQMATSDLMKRFENPISVPVNNDQPSAPSAYREIRDNKYTTEAREALKEYLTQIEILLSNQLFLGNRQDPNGVFKNHFLNDSFQEALPWVDWDPKDF